MIRINQGAEVKHRPGIWSYSCPTHPLVFGCSRQPLLDACRQLVTIYAITGQRVGLFREGAQVASISCPIELGASTTVTDSDRGTPRFAKYVEFDPSRIWSRSSESQLTDVPSLLQVIVSTG